MKIFFVCYEETWHFLGAAFRQAGFNAPNQARSGMSNDMESRLGLYHTTEAPIALVVMDEAMARDGAERRVAKLAPGIAVVKFTFDPQVIRQNGWEWYPAEIKRLFQKRATAVTV